MSEIKEYIGKLRKVVFYNESTKYIVARIDEETMGKSITVTGNMYSYKENQTYRFMGSETFHPKYGKQIKLVSYEEVLASDEDEIIHYLSSSLFKGIGKVVASRIVEQLGCQCIQLIIEDKNNLKGIKGLNDEKINLIYDTLVNEHQDQKIVQYLMKYHFNMGVIDALIKTYQDETLDMMQMHPYATISKIDGLSFRMVDEYALAIGYEREHEERIEALIIYVIQQYCYQQGHTFIYEEDLFYQLSRYDESLLDLCEKELRNLVQQKKVIQKENRYFLAAFERSEQFISDTIKYYLAQSEEMIDEKRIEEIIEQIENKYAIEYSMTQKEAIYDFMHYPFMVLTGGPGTGKTTLVKACLEVYAKINEEKKVLLAAPTGRAAKRLADLTNLEASTIHRLLKWDMNSNEFGMDEENPIQCDLLVIDEFSMVDTLLFFHLLKACTYVKKILIIGDEKQLPSVLPGQVLSDLLQVEKIHHIELKEVFRQKEDSGIIHLAHAMRNDENIEYHYFGNYQDIYFLHTPNVLETVEKFVLKAINEGYDENDIQVLAPMYKGKNGIDAINQLLQNMLNPAETYKTEMKAGSKIYRVGDKVLQLKNRIDDDVFNGDIGTIEEIHFKGDEYPTDTIIINYDGNLIEYGSQDFIEFTHAYCMSIHKSQGSEFKLVFLVLTTDFYMMLQKKLIYTAITRAKQTLIMIGDFRAFQIGNSKEKEKERNTYLMQRFIEEQSELTPFDFMEGEYTPYEVEEIDFDEISPYDFM